MKLGTLLLRDAAISLGQLEAALRNQILCGGRLGTNLVELDYIDLDTLTRYLAEIRGLPPATQEMFESATKSIIDEFGANRAERFGAFPLGPAGDDSGALAVAIVDPDDSNAIEELAQESGHSVVAYVAPELRIYYYLEKHYGIARKARFIREGSDRPTPTDQVERRRTQPLRGIALPPKIRFEPRAKNSLSQPEIRRSQLRRRARTTGDRLGMSYRDACSTIDRAGSREAIADVLMEFTRDRFEVAAIFIVRDANAIGWRLRIGQIHDHRDSSAASKGGAADGPDRDADTSPDNAATNAPKSAGSTGAAVASIDTLSLPLGGASALQEAHDSGTVYRGGATSVGRPIERELWRFLQMNDEPVEMLVVPIVVRRRVVNLIYAHGKNHGAIDSTAAKKLGELAKRSSRAYTRLIQTTSAADPRGDASQASADDAGQASADDAGSDNTGSDGTSSGDDTSSDDTTR
ncbi:MAG: hypothetical protein MJE77_32835 [Proteobacteria bacterium]|nr:hypothetical protein [Pseudomonadota bacterium]